MEVLALSTEIFVTEGGMCLVVHVRGLPEREYIFHGHDI